jgi:cryptochrome
MNQQFANEFSLLEYNKQQQQQNKNRIKETKGIIHWFRKGLRLHDNPALMSCLADAQSNLRKQNPEFNYFIFPVFIIDPVFADPEKVGINRYRFLLESLKDLDDAFKQKQQQQDQEETEDNDQDPCCCRLFVAKGNPNQVLPKLCEQWNVSHVTWERDTEPYARTRDESMTQLLTAKNIRVSTFVSHTLYDPARLLQVNPPSCSPLPTTTYSTFVKMTEQLGQPQQPANSKQDALDMIISINKNNNNHNIDKKSRNETFFFANLLSTVVFDVPTLSQMGYDPSTLSGGDPAAPSKFPGGETEGLRRLAAKVSDPAQHAWVRNFSKPETSPNSLEPSTTVLSPYMKFGCVSPRLFYHELLRIERAAARNAVVMKPPVSLRGQLLWREFNYFSSFATPNFHSMEGNPNCRKIPWDRDAETILAWKEGRTGYPWIDAAMRQLASEGWIHHLARHAVACFLTRGDLWQHWEEGAKVFDLYLLDADYALNTSNWLWLSASCFFYQYFRVYSPVSFGAKTDPTGEYVRKYVPQLRRFPAKYIYEPWKAPLSVQRECGCVIGKDYPKPIVDHAKASKDNMAKMAAAYKQANEGPVRRDREE